MSDSRSIEVLAPPIPNREGAQQKGRRYVVEGRLRILYCDDRTVRAIVRGQGAVHRVEYAWGLWRCSCPARTRCAHLVAVQLVTAPDGPVDHRDDA